ncbi:MAG: primosomal protein N' [Rhodoferax sp.]|uniref:replication restart helicase PriA n=1 Tax=Rhodoferax sp. TaxID=50421 RepID=UPI00260F68EB|nr:primosomal protein N' [Rhodoferax sp.]MDD2881152.1 primosomal protein N' [Rhodoferax sp.]
MTQTPPRLGTLTPVLVHTPAYSQMAGALTYLSDSPLPPGTLVRVPLGQRELLGVVWDTAPQDGATSPLDPAKLRPIAAALDALPPLSANWRALISFAASYYQRATGEVALAALPPQLRDMSSVQLARKLKKLAKAAHVPSNPAHRQDTSAGLAQGLSAAQSAIYSIVLSAEQTGAISQFHQNSGPFLLFGATGSGKTEVFMQCTAELLANSPNAQALVMVPEINLTPQLEERFKARFCALYGEDTVVSMHSGMTPAQRLNSWLAAHSGAARIVLGTRMAVFASMPQLKLIIVDEEHDPSYKSNEGARYSARDLAIYRARLEGAKVMLGSATPSLESWHHSRPAAEGGRYMRLDMPSRVGSGQLPLVRRVDMNHQAKSCVISPPLLAAIAERIARGEQSMVFLNRRGYAPVLQCTDCDWKSECPNCSAYRVFHKIDRTLRCHHCGFSERVPRACPACGNPDIAPLGRGTERLEEHLAELLTGVLRPDGQPVRIVRIDADTTRLKGALESQLAQVHTGEVDVLVGTQMIAKGHDFRRITLVAAVNPDNALFSSDFRAPERLFSLLMQAAGRAGRDSAVAGSSEMWLQTFHPTHPLFEALKKHDYPAFAASQLKERQQAAMPPFSFQALVRAEARTQEIAQGFLNLASQAAAQQSDTAALLAHLTLYPAVPMSIARIANIERAQMLVESPSRAALQRFLTAWQGVLHSTRQLPDCKGVMRWAIDVDPLNI